jgi:hypothetical protein
MSRSEKNAGKVKEKLEAFIQAGSFYEAEQMYQTLFARLNVQKKHDECAELMLFGALQLLANHQVCDSFAQPVHCIAA